MKEGLSDLPSCHLSGCFPGIGSLDFHEFWHGERDPYEVVRHEPKTGRKLNLN